MPPDRPRRHPTLLIVQLARLSWFAAAWATLPGTGDARASDSCLSSVSSTLESSQGAPGLNGFQDLKAPTGTHQPILSAEEVGGGYRYGWKTGTDKYDDSGVEYAWALTRLQPGWAAKMGMEARIVEGQPVLETLSPTAQRERLLRLRSTRDPDAPSFLPRAVQARPAERALTYRERLEAIADGHYLVEQDGKGLSRSIGEQMPLLLMPEPLAKVVSERARALLDLESALRSNPQASETLQTILKHEWELLSDDGSLRFLVIDRAPELKAYFKAHVDAGDRRVKTLQALEQDPGTTLTAEERAALRKAVQLLEKSRSNDPAVFAGIAAREAAIEEGRMASGSLVSRMRQAMQAIKLIGPEFARDTDNQARSIRFYPTVLNAIERARAAGESGTGPYSPQQLSEKIAILKGFGFELPKRRGLLLSGLVIDPARIPKASLKRLVTKLETSVTRDLPSLPKAWQDYSLEYGEKVPKFLQQHRDHYLKAYQDGHSLPKFLEKLGFEFDLSKREIRPPTLTHLFGRLETLMGEAGFKPGDGLRPAHVFYLSGKPIPVPFGQEPPPGAARPTGKSLLSTRDFIRILTQGYFPIGNVTTLNVSSLELFHDLAHFKAFIEDPSFGKALVSAYRDIDANWARYSSDPHASGTDPFVAPEGGNNALHDRQFYVTEAMGLVRPEHLPEFNLALPPPNPRTGHYHVTDVKQHLQRMKLSAKDLETRLRGVLDTLTRLESRMGGTTGDMATVRMHLENRSHAIGLYFDTLDGLAVRGEEAILGLREKNGDFESRQRALSMLSRLETMIAETAKLSPAEWVAEAFKAPRPGSPLHGFFTKTGLFDRRSRYYLAHDVAAPPSDLDAVRLKQRNNVKHEAKASYGARVDREANNATEIENHWRTRLESEARGRPELEIKGLKLEETPYEGSHVTRWAAHSSDGKFLFELHELSTYIPERTVRVRRLLARNALGRELGMTDLPVIEKVAWTRDGDRKTGVKVTPTETLARTAYDTPEYRLLRFITDGAESLYFNVDADALRVTPDLAKRIRALLDEPGKLESLLKEDLRETEIAWARKRAERLLRNSRSIERAQGVAEGLADTPSGRAERSLRGLRILNESPATRVAPEAEARVRQAIEASREQVPCPIGACTPEQLKKKHRILGNGGLSGEQIRVLIESGLP